MRPLLRPLVLAAVLLPAAACEQPEPEPEAPDIAAHYTLTAQQVDSDCLPEIASADQIFGFLEETVTGVPVLVIDLSQSGTALEGILTPSDCVWTGVVDTAGTFTLSGPCDGADIGRTGRIAATVTSFGDGWDLDGSFRIEADTLDGDGNPAPDGVVDCEVLLDLAGTGI